MTDDHRVASGDHLTRIAAQRGFRNYPPLWNDPANRALRSTRGTPHQLAVGDVVRVRDLELREVNRATEQRHQFKVTLPELVARIRVRTWTGDPWPDLPSEVSVDGRPRTATTADGTLTVAVEPNDDRITIRLGELEVTARIGHLQPVATLAGARERLNNLGYDAGDSDDAADHQIRSALEEFQCDHGLLVDGRLGPQSRAALVKAHGC